MPRAVSVLHSEYVVSIALKNCFPDFLSGLSSAVTFTKFPVRRMGFRKAKLSSRQHSPHTKVVLAQVSVFDDGLGP
jgi:hypothetical protein